MKPEIKDPYRDSRGLVGKFVDTYDEERYLIVLSKEYTHDRENDTVLLYEIREGKLDPKYDGIRVVHPKLIVPNTRLNNGSYWLIEPDLFNATWEWHAELKRLEEQDKLRHDQ